jgi:hypothetical protein
VTEHERNILPAEMTSAQVRDDLRRGRSLAFRSDDETRSDRRRFLDAVTVRRSSLSGG